MGEYVPVIQEAPVFRPTEQEWKDPIKYIQLIQPQAAHAGICKIVPPRTFRPPFAVDKETFQFRTRIQTLCKLEAVARVEREFMHDLRVTLFKKGTPMGIDPLPMVPAQVLTHVVPLRLYQLHATVAKLGGGVKVITNNLWAKVTELMFGDEHARDSALVKSLEKAYEQYLLPCTEEMSGDKYKVEFKENMDLNQDDIMKMAMEGVHSGVLGSAAGIRSTTAGECARTKCMERCEAVKRRKLEENLEEKAEEEGLALPSIKVGISFWKYFPGSEKSLVGRIKRRISGESDSDPDAVWEVEFLKGDRDRAFTEEIDGDSLIMLVASGETRECAKYAFLDGICQVCFRASRPEALLICDGCNFAYHTFCLENKLSNVPDGDWFCPVCLEDFDESLDHQNTTYESDSMRQLKAHEQRKRAQLSAFGFGEGPVYTIPEFEAFADSFKIDYLNKVKKANPGYNEDLFLEPVGGPEKRRAAYALEQEYWRLVTVNARATEDSELLDLTVSYGSDLDTGSLGSGFPTHKSVAVLEQQIAEMKAEKHSPSKSPKTMRKLDELDKLLRIHKCYAKHGWNLNNLPKHSGSLLQYVDANITGVMVPWLYMGMCFSSFCWHTEDHYFASINYHHFGAPKTWYGVPGTAADKFESAAKALAPELFDARPDLLTGIVTQFSPSELAKQDVPVFHTVQYEGDFVLTFPRAYHGGFNHGFNCAEAVNFATPDWLGFGGQCLTRYCELRKQPVISHEALLCSLYSVIVSADLDSTLEIARHLFPELDRMVTAEITKRNKIKVDKEVIVLKEHPVHTESMESNKTEVPSIVSPVHGVKRKTPGMMGQVEVTGSHNEGRERGTDPPAQGVMSRMGGGSMSSFYKSMVQCHICRRFCSLSYVWRGDTRIAYCLDHCNFSFHKTDACLVELVEDETMTTMATRLKAYLHAMS